MGEQRSTASLKARLKRITVDAALVGALAGVATPALACPFGPRPTEPDVAFIAACAGSGFNVQDQLVLTRENPGRVFGYLATASADESPSNGVGGVFASARVSEIAPGRGLILNPDLHASALVSLHKNVVDTPGDGYAIASASFRDVIRIASRVTGPQPLSNFRMEFDLSGLLRSTFADGGASEAWAGVTVNLSLFEIDRQSYPPGSKHAAGFELSTLSGQNGMQARQVAVELDVAVGQEYVLSGSLDVFATGRGGAQSEARAAADFSNSLRFAGMHFFTDASQTTEFTDLSVVSAFGFDYRLPAQVPGEVPGAVPEPSTLALLAAIGMLAGRRGARRRA